MIKFFVYILNKFSRIIFWIIPNEFKNLNSDLEKKLKNNLIEETFYCFKEQFKKSVLFYDIEETREYAIKKSLSNDKNKEYYYLEFGVFKGTSANYLSKFIDKLYCFDSFEGLNEDWLGTNRPVNAFNLNKKIPKLNSNIEPVVGWVEDTLDKFLKEHNPKINFVHIDLDTYGPTKFTLEKLKPYLIKNSILIFDELYNYIGWEHGEYKALMEVFDKDEFEYKAFNLIEKQCVIQIK